jgi:hypothetical protein
MAKRFTDTNKWKDTWFQDLPNKYKLFWIYLLDECDAAGLWKPNMRLAQFQIGEPFEEVELRRVFADRIQITEEGYWYIPKFIDFQYGQLSDKSKPHISIINLLKKHKIKGYPKGIDTLKEKEKEEDKEQEQEEEDRSISFYKDKIECFNEWQSNERLIEEILMLIQKFGFKSAEQKHVINIFRNFLLVEFSITKTKADHEQHLRRWVNKMGKKIHEYAS